MNTDQSPVELICTKIDAVCNNFGQIVTGSLETADVLTDVSSLSWNSEAHYCNKAPKRFAEHFEEFRADPSLWYSTDF